MVKNAEHIMIFKKNKNETHNYVILMTEILSKSDFLVFLIFSVKETRQLADSRFRW